MYFVQFEVTGAGHFPFDMLRYDGAFPLRQEDVEKLATDMHMMSSDEKHKVLTEPRTIQLGAHSHTKNCPTNDRWRSFGWSVKVISQVKNA